LKYKIVKISLKDNGKIAFFLKIFLAILVIILFFGINYIFPAYIVKKEECSFGIFTLYV